MSEDIFHCHNQAGANLHNEEKPRKLLIVPQEKTIHQHDPNAVPGNCGAAAVCNASVTALWAAGSRTAGADSCGEGCVSTSSTCGSAALLSCLGT